MQNIDLLNISNIEGSILKKNEIELNIWIFCPSLLSPVENKFLMYFHNINVLTQTSICCCQKRKQNRAHTQHTDTIQKDREKQDCRDVMSVRQTSRPSAAGGWMDRAHFEQTLNVDLNSPDDFSVLKMFDSAFISTIISCYISFCAFWDIVKNPIHSRMVLSL